MNAPVSAQDRKRIQQAISESEAEFKKEDIEVEVEDSTLVVKNPPKNPHFPFTIFFFACLKDLLDILDLTVIGIILTKILSILFGIILFFWCWGKVHGGWWKKKLIRYLWRRYIIAMCVEIIPFVGIIPANMIFILMVHYREKKVVKIFNGLLERLHDRGVKGD